MRFRWIAVAALAVGCKGGTGSVEGLSPRAYCERRQAAWERAFPDMEQTAEQRALYVDGCTRGIEQEEAEGAWSHRRRCFDEHIRGTGKPEEEYMAMTSCEAAGAR